VERGNARQIVKLENSSLKPDKDTEWGVIDDRAAFRVTITQQNNLNTLSSHQVIWVCILCRKKQELLSKTGQWINKSTSPEGLIRHGGSDTRVSLLHSLDLLPASLLTHDSSFFFGKQTTLLNPHDTSDKRPKLERARSAAEKENQPLQRTGSLLRRQYSQQETSTQRRASASASDSGVDDSYIQRSHLHSQHQQGITGSSNVDGQYMNQSPLYRNTSSSYYPSTSYPPEDDPRYYQVSAECCDLDLLIFSYFRLFVYRGKLRD
jgi:regulating synaptic membrane exocytosis protein 2